MNNKYTLAVGRVYRSPWSSSNSTNINRCMRIVDVLHKLEIISDEEAWSVFDSIHKVWDY